MIHKKEFYFIRHGQTDYNILPNHYKVDHPSEVPLNATGRTQANRIEPLIAALPIKTVCCSPFIRAQETKEIVTSRLNATHHELEELGECSAAVWQEMAAKKLAAPLHPEGHIRHFLERVRHGVNRALSQEGPVLIIAHGGIHFAICSWMNLTNHDWAVDNCVPIRFYCKEEQWTAESLKICNCSDPAGL